MQHTMQLQHKTSFRLIEQILPATWIYLFHCNEVIAEYKPEDRFHTGGYVDRWMH